MLERQLDLVQDRGLFFIDFWNGGPMSGGCMCAGRSGGYFYVDWNGDVSPCVFVPYAVDNVHDLYQGGRSLTSVLGHPVFEGIRAWQKQYAGREGNGHARCQNLFVPCPMRDHHEVVRDLVTRFQAKPTSEDARAALESPAYRGCLMDYGHRLSELLDPMWQDEVMSREEARKAGGAQGEPPRSAAQDPVPAALPHGWLP